MALLWILPAGHTATAAPVCELDPARPKFYRLELTVPAVFCRGAGSDAACLAFPKPSLLQLHGLWPNYRSGYPEGRCPASECPPRDRNRGRYCGYPDPPGLYASTWWNGMKGYMAGTESCLERHEWVKHGTCSPMDAPAYFRWSLEATKHIAERLNLPGDRPISRSNFNERARTNLPELDGALRLTCKEGALSSLYVLYEWGEAPAKPIPTRDGTNHFGNCPASFTIPSTPDRRAGQPAP